MNELTFKSHTLTPIIVKNQPYLGYPQIADALQYRNARIVSDVYNRHADEFTPDMSFLTTVDTTGGKQQVRVFSLRGCHLLAMFSKTPVAKEFRKWVLDLIEQCRQEVDKPVIVSEHTRSLPSGKKEIVLSEKAKAEIGGIVKSCVAFAAREELAAIMSGSGKTEYWEVSDRDLLYQLYHWHATKNKKDTLEFRRLHAENDRLAAENADLKNRMSQISSWVR